MMKTIKPAKNQIFARPQKESETTKSGLYIPGQDKKSTHFAEVISVGSEVKDYKKGDTIVYKEYMNTEITLEKENYILIDHIDVLGVVQ